MEKVLIETGCGYVKGRKKRNGYEFLGIPYGKAKRFCPPAPVSWMGVRDCLSFGSAAPQPNFLGVKPEGKEFALVGSEDCLNLNIWSADIAEDSRLPVVIYVHGGGFQVGSNAVPARSGDCFMEEDRMVFVSVNYRLGVMGFLQLPDSEIYPNSGNCGMMDLLLAIRWVAKEIAHFGGDPENITLMGISAGAKAIGAMMTLPEVQQIAKKLVLESGALQAFRDRHTAVEIRNRFLATCPESPTEMPLEELVRLQAEFCDAEGTTCYFGPVLDGTLFPTDMEIAWKALRRWQGKALIGSGKNELAALAGQEDFLKNPSAVLERLFGIHKDLAMKKYSELQTISDEPRQNWNRVLSDFMYRYYSNCLAEFLENGENPVWMYSFDYGEAFHGMGFHFLMNQWSAPHIHLPETNWENAEGVARYFRTGVRNFILNGSPEGRSVVWPEYHGKNKMIFSEQPHMEQRADDTLKGFPDCVICL